MYTSVNILILLVDIKRVGSPDSNLNFYDQVVRVGKGWVEHGRDGYLSLALLSCEVMSRSLLSHLK